MRVRKRSGELEEISYDKILNRIRKLGMEVDIHINYSALAMKVISKLQDNISTTQIDEFAASECAMLSATHPDYGTLAARIIISNHHKNTSSQFNSVIQSLYDFTDVHGKPYPLISKDLMTVVSKYAEQLEEMIDYNRDYLIDYFGFKTLESSYLFKKNGVVIERPQHMWMRVAIGIHSGDLDKVKETYDLMSQKYFTHATPTLFNAGTNRPQLSSCYLIAMADDSVNGIYDTLKDCALISKYSGGVGLHIHNVRAKGSHIRGTNGLTDGIVPMLKVYNDTACYINQSGKRNGSFAIYLEPWHADILDFLELRKNHGDEKMKARDLFYAIWMSDLFMERIKQPDSNWSLFCPDECPGLSDVCGQSFKDLYIKYETDGRARKVIKARDLWFRILDSQMETGTPYLLYKDAINQKSNQKNLGTIKSSNLCCEITQFSDSEETSVCNLASIALPTFVNKETRTFDFDKLHQVAQVVTNNLNRIIDINFYPTEKTRVSNMRHRPVGIGVQGLADTFVLMNMPFHSDAARALNKDIFETIYHAALEKSNKISRQQGIDIMNIWGGTGDRELLLDKYVNKFEWSSFNKRIKEQNYSWIGAYSSFEGSPASEGVLQFDMWSVKPTSGRYNWDQLKSNIMKYGLRNSLLVAPMPTASTSQILGFNECFEPFTSNLYSRRVLAGEFVVPNKYLMKELIELGLWNEQVKNNIIVNKGSIQQLTNVPDNIKNKYKVVWEIPMKHIIDMAADRGAFICQSQSMNLWMAEPTYNKLTSMHFYSWEKGLKTGMYYLRSQAKHQAQQFTIEPSNANDGKEDDDDICHNCSA